MKSISRILKHRPLVPEMGDNRTTLVREYQMYLNAVSPPEEKPLAVDGSYGIKTAARAMQLRVKPAEIVVPQVGLWSDRKWVSDLSGTISNAHRAGVDRVALFLNGMNDRQKFDPFCTQGQVLNALSSFEAAEIAVDVTAWLSPYISYSKELLKFVRPLLGRGKGKLALDLDTEQVFSDPSVTDDQAMIAADTLLDEVDARLVSVNDRASISKRARRLIARHPVRPRGQFYSVGKKDEIETTTTSVYYPGETQAYGMSSKRWRPFIGRPFEIGLAAYSPFKSLSIDEQVLLQVRASLWYSPTMLWFWEADTSPEYLDAIRKATVAD